MFRTSVTFGPNICHLFRISLLVAIKELGRSSHTRAPTPTGVTFSNTSAFRIPHFGTLVFPMTFNVSPIGYVNSTLQDRLNAPRQGWLGAPDARLQILPEFHDCL